MNTKAKRTISLIIGAIGGLILLGTAGADATISNSAIARQVILGFSILGIGAIGVNYYKPIKKVRRSGNFVTDKEKIS